MILRIPVLCCCVLLSSCLAIRAETIGYWRFEGDSTGFIADSSGNGFTLTKGDGSDTTTYPTQQTLPASGDGQYFDDPISQNDEDNAKAASLDRGDWFTHADAPLFTVSDFTIEAYIHRDANDVRHVIAAQYNGDGQRSWGLLVGGSDVADDPNNQLAMILSDDGEIGSTHVYRSNIQIDAGVDYFVAASFDESDISSGLTFYVKNLATGAWSESTIGHGTTSLHDSTGEFKIGAYSAGSRCFDGLIDEVRWSNTVLPKSDLLAVPEPSALVLMIVGGFGLLMTQRWKR